MPDFEAVGRQYIIDQIEALESAKPGWMPMFYMTCTYEGDLQAAALLRAEYKMPRPDEITLRISREKTRFVEREAIARAERDHHKRMMREDWIYWVRFKLGVIKREGSA